jgi:quercetin dioxygenase-like cupin family protein
MHRPVNRGLLRILAILGTGVVLAAVAALPMSATPPHDFASTVLARGTDMSEGTIVFTEGTDIVVARNVIEVGGSSGWHSHPGGAIVVVQQGEVTLHKAVGNHCEVTTYTAGQSFFERPSGILDAVNTSSGQTIVVVTFPGVPIGGSSRIDRPNPGVCPGF